MDAARRYQILQIASTLLASWLGMQAVHECGHVLGAWSTGGRVKQVVLNPLTISRTDVEFNPHPLIEVWAGPVVGVLLPLLIWGMAAVVRLRGAFVLRFFAGFCAVANGSYLALGSFGRVGDCGELLQFGTPIWLLWLFGAITVPLGFWLWNRQSSHFGLGNGRVDPRVAWTTFVVALLLLALGFAVDGR